MKKITISNIEDVRNAGLIEYRNLADPEGFTIGDKPILFYRDMLEARLGNESIASCSVVQTWKRPFIIDEIEQHMHCCEILLPLNDDVILFAGEATDNHIPNTMMAFIVPKGTLVVFKTGVWHKAPFPINQNIVQSLVILPPLTYANDCRVIQLSENDSYEIIEG